MSGSNTNGRYKTSTDDDDDDTVALTQGPGDASLSGPGSASSTVTDPEDELHDGCIVLGVDASRGNRYCTRYHIDRAKQRELLSLREVLSHACCPCCLREKQTSCLRSVWQFIRAEAFLISLHLSVIVLGVLKEALNLREIAEDIHLIHSIVETLVTVLIIVIRLVSAWYNFKLLKKLRHKIEYVDLTKGIKTRSKALTTFLKLYTGVAILMLCFVVITFFLFYALLHLGWTIMSNNFALILVMACDALLRDRMSVESNLIKGDHNKAVMYEMSLLLKESTEAAEGPQRKCCIHKVEKFQRALRDTNQFAQPDYIYVPDDYKGEYDKLNMFKTLEIETGV